jgi:hypothetical protein
MSLFFKVFSLSDEEKLIYENLLLKSKSDKSLIENIDVGHVLVPGSHLPSNTNKAKSLISGCLIEGPAYLLEDGKTIISLNEAIMWMKCTPFSPLGTGSRINPL